MNPCRLPKSAVVVAAVLLSTTDGSGGDVRGRVTVLGGKGLEHVVVYIEAVDGKTFPAPVKPAVLDQVRMTFVPHVLPILVGTTVEFPNSDSTRHNVFSPSKPKRFNLGTYPAGVTKRVAFERPGVVSLLCNVHAEMSAYVIVLQNPHYSMLDKRGVYRIENVPRGRYKLVVWHEKLKTKEKQIEIPERGEIVVDFSLDE